MINGYLYQHLELKDIHKIFQNSILFHKKRVLNYIDKNGLNEHFIKNKQIINLLTRISIFSSIYNLNIEEILSSISMCQSYQEIKKFFDDLKKEINHKKQLEKNIIYKGLINRILYGTKLPPIFQDNKRVFIKIPDIPHLFQQMQLVVNHLNINIPTTHHIRLKVIDSNPKKKTVFIVDGKKETKFGRFLVSFIKNLENVKKITMELSNDDFKLFTKMLSSKSFSVNNLNSMNHFLKKRTGKTISFSAPLFFELKKISPFQKNEILAYLTSLQSFYIQQQKCIQDIQIREQNPLNLNSNTDKADMIILSTRPKDIARMSEYTDWNSCMAQDDEYSHDLPNQIGVGSIVAYLVNSQNPYKRLGRILLKPFVSINDLKQINNQFDTFYQSVYNNDLKNFERLTLISPYETNKQYLPLLQKIKKAVSDLNIKPILSNRIYLCDKAYGVSQSLFSFYLKEIVKTNINPQHFYGLFTTVSNYYIDTLQRKYYFADPNNPNNIKDYLESTDINFQTIERDNQTYFYTTSLFTHHIRHLNLSGVIAQYAKIHACDLKNIDERGTVIHNLTITDADRLNIFPSNVKIKNSLTLESEKMISVPQNIHCDKLTVECKNLIYIPKDIQTNQLILVHTAVKELPDLTLKLLDARHSNITDIRNLNVTEYLDLSYTPLEYLPQKMHLDRLFLRQCTKLKNLPTDLNVKWLDIGQTSISKLPIQHFECILMVFNTGIKKFPNGLTFNQLEAQGSKLQELPANLKAQKINISKSNVQNLPSNLSVETLIINDTKIKTLPLDLKAKEVHAKRTQINEIPADIQISVLYLTDSPVETIHHTQKIHAFYLNQVPQFIHPDIQPVRFIGISEQDVKLAQERYQEKYLGGIQIARHTNLNTNSSINQFRTLE